jgi:YVTN family beta-propeller protein
MGLRKISATILWVGWLIWLGWGILSDITSTTTASQDTYIFSKYPISKLASSCIAITPDGRLILVANPDSNSLSMVDSETNLLIDEIPVGLEPRGLVISMDGLQAYVTNKGSDALMVIDLSTHQISQEIPLGDQPVGVTISPDGYYLAVAESGEDQVRILKTINLETEKIFKVSDRPYGLTYSPDNRHILVSHLLSGEVTILAYPNYSILLPLQYKAGSIKTETPYLDMKAGTAVTGQGRVIPTWQKVAPAPSVIINQSGTRAYLPQTMGNGLGYNTQFDTTVFPKVSVLNLLSYTHETAEQISIPEVDRPVGLPWDAALSRDDHELWVVNSASNDVSVIDLTIPTHPIRTAHIPVGDNPRGIVLSPNGSLAYVNNTLAGTISVIDTNLYIVTQVITVTEIPLPPALLNGKKLFFSSARSELAQARWISCNTCHVEGGVDGRTWLIQYVGGVPPGEEPVIRRNTTGLFGMIETYPLRWSAEWDESADSEFSIRFEQFGLGLIEGEMYPTLGMPNQGRSYDLDCLALFIDSLLVPERSYSLTPAEQRGRILFESEETQCSLCHPAPLYTDLQTHDVGTADGGGEWFGPYIDTPTLRFLYDSAPYLHDGSAETLWDVLVNNNQQDEHGVTSQLDDQEIQDLIAFLLVLPYTP